MNCTWCGEEIVTEAGVFVHAGDRSRFRFEGNPPHVAADRRQPLDGAEAPMEDTTMAKSKKQLASAIAEGLNTGTDLEATRKKPKNKKATTKRVPKEKAELRTLALRVTNDEFDLVHRAAGPRGLSAFMKVAVLSAANRAVAK